ncbi:MAG: J domain-containing protein [Chloroflexi bacterium]|nr:J domain-containing protein [Chloroflexota bacterium]
MTDRRVLDPYAVLGVPRNATPQQVTRAHRRLAKAHHPDLNAGTDEAAEHMRQINEAWAILSNPVRRGEYDRATGNTSHWVSSRQPITPAAPSSTRTWATWRATAAETEAAPRTIRPPGEQPIPRTRRPPRPSPQPETFRDSGWAALIAGVLILGLLIGAIIVGRLAL